MSGLLLGEKLDIAKRSLRLSATLASGLLLYAIHPALADEAPPPSPHDAQDTLPQTGFFSSLRQALNKGSEHEVVRGHFDLGTAPNVHRYYCLVDAKSGRREPNGVLGDPIPAADGMTAVKGGSVSLYSCNDAEKQGLLVTTGYVLAMVPAAIPAAPLITSPNRPASGVDVAGVKLGMSPDEVRAVLRSKKLANYSESVDVLRHAGNARFVNVIAAWEPLPDGESFEVMFTPVPGKEHAMAIAHTVSYSAGEAIRETALRNGLIKKYGGFSSPEDMPASPTWRFQPVGDVQVGDTCGRRAILGGLSAVQGGKLARPNLALNTTLDEFRFQIDHCGAAILTEDHAATTDGSHPDRIVTRFTVTAYSPVIGLEGASFSARLIQGAGDGGDKSGLPNL